MALKWRKLSNAPPFILFYKPLFISVCLHMFGGAYCHNMCVEVRNRQSVGVSSARD